MILILHPNLEMNSWVNRTQIKLKAGPISVKWSSPPLDVVDSDVSVEGSLAAHEPSPSGTLHRKCPERISHYHTAFSAPGFGSGSWGKTGNSTSRVHDLARGVLSTPHLLAIWKPLRFRRFSDDKIIFNKNKNKTKKEKNWKKISYAPKEEERAWRRWRIDTLELRSRKLGMV